VLCDKILLEGRVKIMEKEKGKEKDKDKEKKEDKRVLDTAAVASTDSTAASTPHSPPPPLSPVAVPVLVPVPGRKGSVTPPLPLERTEVEVESIPQVSDELYCTVLCCTVL
jgi:hypothetical protein